MSAEARTRSEIKTRLLMKQIKEEQTGMIDTTDLEGFVKRTIEKVMAEKGEGLTPEERATGGEEVTKDMLGFLEMWEDLKGDKK